MLRRVPADVIDQWYAAYAVDPWGEAADFEPRWKIELPQTDEEAAAELRAFFDG